jgi:hypothetical protein
MTFSRINTKDYAATAHSLCVLHVYRLVDHHWVNTFIKIIRNWNITWLVGWLVTWGVGFPLHCDYYLVYRTPPLIFKSAAMPSPAPVPASPICQRAVVPLLAPSAREQWYLY